MEPALELFNETVRREGRPLDGEAPILQSFVELNDLGYPDAGQTCLLEGEYLFGGAVVCHSPFIEDHDPVDVPRCEVEPVLDEEDRDAMLVIQGLQDSEDSFCAEGVQEGGWLV